MQFSVQKRALTMSIISIVFSTINIILLSPFGFMGFGIFALYFHLQEISEPSTENEGGYDVTTWSQFANQMMTYLGIIALILCLINLIFSIVLLVGVIKGRFRLLRCWYVGTVVLTVIYVVRSITDFILASIYGNFAYISASFSYFLFGGFYTVLLFLAVRPYMKEIEAGGPVTSGAIGMDEPEHCVSPYQTLHEEQT